MPTRVPILYGPMAVLERRQVSNCCCFGFFFILLLYIYTSYALINKYIHDYDVL